MSTSVYSYYFQEHQICPKCLKCIWVYYTIPFFFNLFGNGLDFHCNVCNFLLFLVKDHYKCFEVMLVIQLELTDTHKQRTLCLKFYMSKEKNEEI